MSKSIITLETLLNAGKINQNDMLWWNELSDYWKNAFNEYPFSIEEFESISEEDINQTHPLVLLKKAHTLNFKLYEDMEDIAPLAYLTQLKKLTVSDTLVRDLSPLASLVNLEELDISANRFDDISPISGLINLKKLDIGMNSIPDLWPVSNLTNLEFLDMSLIDYDEYYEGDKELHYWDEDSLEPLRYLAKLKHLIIDQTIIECISPLVELKNLEILEIGYNYISDFTPLYQLKSLKKLKIGKTWQDYDKFDAKVLFQIRPLLKLEYLEEIALASDSFLHISFPDLIGIYDETETKVKITFFNYYN